MDKAGLVAEQEMWQAAAAGMDRDGVAGYFTFATAPGTSTSINRLFYQCDVEAVQWRAGLALQ